MKNPSIRVACSAVLVSLLIAGCARDIPDTPVSESPSVAAQQGTPQPAGKPAVQATPQGASKAAPPVAKRPAAAPALDLNALEAQLRETKAIGIFTKITLKNQVNDLLDKFREYYQGTAALTMRDLRRSYDLLMMKVLSLLQDADEKLASAIVSSREAIWGLLTDEKKFAAFQG